MPNFWKKLKKLSLFSSQEKKKIFSLIREIGDVKSVNFWNRLDKPFFCLAPMEEVTDVVFREMFARYSGQEVRDKRPVRQAPGRQETSGNNFVMFTEFINVDGLTHPEGYKKLKIDLKYTEAQRPIVAQIWGTNPDKFYQAARLIAKLGFDGIDINMGCPQDKEIGIGACAALIRNPELAKQIIVATKKGAGDLPVSIKTRLGYSKPEEMEEWLTALLSTNIAAVTIHARTKQEKSKVPARWNKIKEAVVLRDKIQEKRDKDNKTLIIGNGDVKSCAEGLERAAETGCDGVMIGRGAFGYPWIFQTRTDADLKRTDTEENQNLFPSIRDRLAIMLEHAELFEQKLGKVKPFVIMRKHFKAYASGFPGSSELRVKLMAAKDLAETKNIVEEFFATKL